MSHSPVSNITPDTALTLVPNHIFLDETFIQLCVNTATARTHDPIEQKVYANLLSLKSQRLRQAYAMTFLAQQQRIILSVAQKNKLFDFEDADLLDTQYLKRFAAKIMLHRLYRLCRRRTATSHTLIRAWVDMSETLFQSQMQDAVVFIYPTTSKWSRQWQLIKRCKKGLYTLMGVPYQLRALWTIFRASHGRDLLIVREEICAHQQHADDFLSHPVQNIYTTDEFECAPLALYHALPDHITVTNVAHGIGACCPFVGYDHFVNFHPQQNIFYQRWNPGIKYALKPYRTQPTTHSQNKKPVLVFVHQPFTNLNLHYEHHAQTQLIEMCQQVAHRLNIQFLVKLHPAATPKTRNTWPDSVIAGNTYLEHYRPIFVSLYSAAFFEFVYDGPFFLLRHDLLTPETYFGDTVEVIDSVALAATIQPLINLSDWQQRQAQHITRLTRINQERTACVE